MSILALTSDTLIGTPATGNLEYNGQFFGTDSNASRAQMQRIVQATAVASTSGTSIDFTALPAWVKRVTVILNGVSTSGTSNLQCRIGVGTVTTSGYTSTCTDIGGSNTTATSGYLCSSNISAASVMSGVFVICLNSSNRYAVSGTITRSGIMMLLAGDVTLSGALDIVRITTVNGTDTFDAGSVNLLLEG